MSDYERIARIMAFLDQHYTEQPDLALLAGKLGLSPSHFHRLFSTWAGITPKDFVRCLTFEHARRLLEAGQSVLETALDAGLSGPGRLHDLCISLESASPGEIQRRGAQWRIVAGFAPTLFGTCLIAEGPRGVCHLSFVDGGQEDSTWADLQERWPKAELSHNDAAAVDIAQQVFAQPADSMRHPPLRAFVKGTPFQVQVWRALLRVTPGRLTTYSRLAKMIDHPTAARAVGAAVGRNPLAWLIPCHRVIRETGVIGEYHWGSTRKKVMIAVEGARAEQERE
jgi:AraC family transcriptional regulator, regulatory protein of adaptative response / methylated-DNA-[protein]-cysteine methyltransferase